MSLKVGIDTSPLASGHAVRGVGAYTRLLTEALKNESAVEVFELTTNSDRQGLDLDLIHYPFFDLFFATLPVVELIKRVVTVHDVIPLRYPEQYPAGVKGKLKLEKQKLALKAASAVITDSEASKADIIEFLNIADEKIHVVPLAGNPAIGKVRSSVVERVRKEYRLPKNYILYVGDINYNKNIPQLIKALKFLPDDVSLVCVGRNFYPHAIPEWQVIDTQIEMSQVRDRVVMINSLLTESSEDLSALYTGAVVYVQPSLYEGFGLPVLEAMQAGTPVVAAQTSSLPEVGGEIALYAEPEAEALAAAIEPVLEWSDYKRRNWSQAATKWLKQFSWKKTARATLKVYQEVVGQK